MGLAKIGRDYLYMFEVSSGQAQNMRDPRNIDHYPATDTANFQAKAQLANPKSVLALGNWTRLGQRVGRRGRRT